MTLQGVAASWVSILNPASVAPLVSRWPLNKDLADLGVRQYSHLTVTLYDPARLLPATEPSKPSWLRTLFRRVKHLVCQAYKWVMGSVKSEVPEGTVRLLVRTTNGESPLLAICK